MSDSASDSATAVPDNTAATPSSADYVVVARRYRPQTFDELIGQEHVSQALSRAIASDRVGHAYLFTGARGVGKTSAARILAKALNCAEGTSPTPCNQCEICLSVSTGDDVDVLEIDGASNRGIDEIRQLRQNVAVRPSRARFKIYIIDEVHMLTKEAFNALLKTLEEPPDHVKFIFATTEPNKIPVTILSRCQRYDFAGIESAEIQTRLSQIAEAEGVSIAPDALQLLAIRAAGSMRDSQSLLEQLLSTGAREITAGEVTQMLGIAPAARLSSLVLPLVERNAAQALAELDTAVSGGAEVSQLVDQLLGYFRDAMTQAVGCEPNRMLHALPGQYEEVGEVGKKLSVPTLLAIVQILDQAAARMRVSTHNRTIAEMALVRICHLEDLEELASLVAALKQGNLQATAPVKKNGVANASKPLVPPPRSEPVHGGSASTAVELTASEQTRTTANSSPRPHTPLTRENVEEIWQRTIEGLSSMVADHAEHADQVTVDAQGRLIVEFSEKFHRDACERATNRARIEAALEETCGVKVPLILRWNERTDAPAKPVARPKTRRQQQAELAAQPFVQKALQLFEGDPSRLRYVPPPDEQ